MIIGSLTTCACPASAQSIMLASLWHRECRCCINNTISLLERQSAQLAAQTVNCKLKKNNFTSVKHKFQTLRTSTFYFSRILRVISFTGGLFGPNSLKVLQREVISKGRGERSTSVFKLKFVPGETERMTFPQWET